MRISFGVTDIGRIREENEDSFLLDPKKRLYIVADGLGGHKAGEMASKYAIEFIDSYFSSELIMELVREPEKIRNEMIGCLSAAGQKVFEKAQRSQRYKGMGTTVVVALVQNNLLHVGHVGDSRAYIYNQKYFKLLTSDHSHIMSLVKVGKITMEEARVSPYKSKLTQAIGMPCNISPDHAYYPLKKDDIVVLCSDGLWEMLTDKEIFNILEMDKSPKDTCEKFVEAANDAGGRDNITVIIYKHFVDK